MPDSEAMKRSRRRYYDKGRQLTIDAKKYPCADCGVEYPYYVMQFHHRDRSQKLFNIGATKTRGLVLLAEEIKKCDVLCSNCHAVRTHILRDELRPRVS